MLCLEGQQAGLSWITVLRKREAYREHFFQFPIAKIAQFSDADLENKLQDAGLIRHIGKLKAIRDNATAWQHLSQELKPQQSNVCNWLWSFVNQQIEPMMFLIIVRHWSKPILALHYPKP